MKKQFARDFIVIFIFTMVLGWLFEYDIINITWILGAILIAGVVGAALAIFPPQPMPEIESSSEESEN